MNILWLSWRDIKNPNSGGAEKVAFQVSKRFVRDKSSVTIFTSSFKKSKPQEIVSGVKIIRRGNLLTCRLYAFFYYLKNRNFDIVIDEINTIPFFTIFYCPNKTFPLVHQLAKEYWFFHTQWPFNILGFWLEPFWLKLYKKKPTLVLSQSTKADLKKLGFKNVSIYKIGLDFKPKLVKKRQNLILFIGRLVPAKNPQDAIKAFSIIHKDLPDFKLLLIGKGDKKLVIKLKALISKLHLRKSVILKGYISNQQKVNFLKKAKAVLIPSIREGWGLVATEANALGCIPIAYKIPGLQDAIKNNKNGLLVAPNYYSLAEATLFLLKDEPERIKLANNGYRISQEFSWENSFHDFKSFVNKYATAKN